MSSLTVKVVVLGAVGHSDAAQPFPLPCPATPVSVPRAGLSNHPASLIAYSFPALPDREPLLNRSRTALPSSNRELNPNDPRPSPGGLSPGGANVQRSNTSIVAGRPSPNATIGGPPTRGLSIRKPVGSPPVPQDRTPPAPPKGKPSRLWQQTVVLPTLYLQIVVSLNSTMST